MGGPGNAGGLHRRGVHMIAAHFIGLSEHHMHVFLTREFCIVQRLEDTASRIAMGLDRLHHGFRRQRRIHAENYTRLTRFA